MARKPARRSSYDRAYYERNRKKILRKSAQRYKSRRAKILLYQRKYRRKTKAGTKNYRPMYARGMKSGKRPLYARLARLNAYRFIGRKRGKNSRALGRKSASFRRGKGSNVGRKPLSGGQRALKRR